MNHTLSLLNRTPKYRILILPFLMESNIDLSLQMVFSFLSSLLKQSGSLNKVEATTIISRAKVDKVSFM